MSGTGKQSGGVGSPFKTMLKNTPVGSSVFKQVEEEIETASGNIKNIVGGIGGNIKGGIEDFLGVLGLKSKEGGGLSDKEKKEAKKLGISEWQWKTGGGTNARVIGNVRRAKKRIGMLGDINEQTGVREIDEYNILTGETITKGWDPTAGSIDPATDEPRGAYIPIVGGVSSEDVDIETDEEDIEKTYLTDELIEGGVDGDPISLENLKTQNKTNTDIGVLEKEEKIAIQTEMINAGADLSYTVGGNKVEGLDAADGDWGGRSKQAYKWYTDGNDLKDFVYKPPKAKVKTEKIKTEKIETTGHIKNIIKNNPTVLKGSEDDLFEDSYLYSDGRFEFFEAEDANPEDISKLVGLLSDEEYLELGGRDVEKKGKDSYYDEQVFTKLYGFDDYLDIASKYSTGRALIEMGLPENYTSTEEITINTDNGTYVGMVKDGKFHGEGKFTWNERDLGNKGNYIEGSFIDGKMGFVTLHTKKGLKMSLNMNGNVMWNLAY